MRNKEETKRKLIDAVASIIKAEGFDGLGVNKVARTACVSKILIYRYFGGFPQLINVFIQERDFWNSYSKEGAEFSQLQLSLRDQVSKLLSERFNNFYDHCEMEATVAGQITSQRNGINYCFKEKVADDYPDCFNVMSTLLQAGTDHLILSEPNILGTVPSKNASTKMSSLFKSIGRLVEWTLW